MLGGRLSPALGGGLASGAALISYTAGLGSTPYPGLPNDPCEQLTVLQTLLRNAVTSANKLQTPCCSRPVQACEGASEKYNAIRRGYKEGKTVDQLARRHRTTEAAVRVALTDPLPPIRFHDLRHGAATLSLAANVDIKVVSETLGHSKSSFTRDTYTSVISEVAQAAAEAIVAIVPRSRAAG